MTRSTSFARSTPITRSIALLAALLVFAAGADAQSAGPLKPGDRVLVANPRAREKLTLVAFGADSLSLQRPRGDTVQVSLDDVHALWRSRGRRSVESGIARGAAIGFVIGGVIGVLDPLGPQVVYASPGSVYASPGAVDSFDHTSDTLAFTLFLATIGAGTGAVAGAVFRGERWQRVPIGRLRLAAPPSGAPGLGLSLRF